MIRKRRRFSADFKAKAALAALRGDRTLNQVAAHYEIHPNQVRTWKKQLQQNMNQLFTDPRARGDTEQQELIDRLYHQIGRLQVELDWLKKKSGHED